MTSFVDLVAVRWTEIFGAPPSVSGVGENASEVTLADFRITFSLDERDQSIIVAVETEDTSSKRDYKLDVDVVARFFHYDDDPRADDLSLAGKMDVKIRLVKEIIESIEKAEVSLRDLEFFQTGYNTHYSDHLQQFV